MELKNQDKYEMFIETNYKIYFFKNGKLHREAGPAIVLNKDIEKYTNLSDKVLYKLIDKPLYPPLVDPYSAENFNASFQNIISNDSEYYLEGKEYTEDEFKVLMLKKELDSQLHTNDTISRKPKI
jgi:hypothetical protein